MQTQFQGRFDQFSCNLVVFVLFLQFRRFCLDSRFVFVIVFNFSHFLVFSFTVSHFCKF